MQDISLGEFAALVVAEVLSFQDAIMAVAIRGKAMRQLGSKDNGKMASVSGELATIESILKTEVKDYAIVANKNSTKRTVISGSTKGINEAVKAFKKKKMNPIILNVSSAFHSKIVSPAAKQLAEFLRSIKFNSPPKIKVFSNVTGDTYPTDPEAMRNLLEKQLASPVEWVNQIKLLYQEGARLFFEVGPKTALTSFVSEILEDKKQIATIPVNHPKKGGIKQLNEAIAIAFNSNIPITPENVIYTKLFRNIPITSSSVKKPMVKSKTQTSHSVNGDQLLEEFVKSQGTALKKWLTKSYETFKHSPGNGATIQDLVARYGINFDRIYVTGAAVGLPGKYKEIFDPNNVNRIFAGENLIDPVSEQALTNQTTKNIRKLVKNRSGMASFQEITSKNQVIKLAGQSGKFNFEEEYQLASKLIGAYDISTKLAIAAGLEALKDAGIPLTRDYTQTSKGTYLPGEWVLPKELRENTGVIFASAFPVLNSLAEEMTAYYKNKNVEDLTRLLRLVYGEVARREKTPENQQLLAFLDNELREVEGKKSEYQFHPKFILRVLTMGHSQFAQLIKAQGPNTHLNAACASTTQAIGIGEDWLRAGRCNRVIVIAGDEVSNEMMFEWMGSGFLISGAATIEGEISKAALPFDRRRNGMIVGMGAVGIVLETETESRRRGIKPIVEVLGVHFSNSGFHGTRLDIDHICLEMNKFMDNVWQRHGVSREQVAESCMFMSHETYTPRRGGSSIAEIKSIRSTFGKSADKIIISNTKGFTGHPMGAGVEDVIAIKSLEHGKIPPIANFKEPDENLGNLRLSTGNEEPVNYAFRIGAGFGSQLAFALYKKASSGERKTAKYSAWLESFGASIDDLILVGKTLRVKDKGSNPETEAEELLPKIQIAPISPPLEKPGFTNQGTIPKQTSLNSELIENQALQEPRKLIHELLSELSGFPLELLTPEIKIQQDLGISLSLLTESLQKHAFSISQSDLTDNLTVEQLFTLAKNQKSLGSKQFSKPAEIRSSSADPTFQPSKEKIMTRIVEIVAEETQYPPDFLDPTLDMEADLGIDTVKQAEIFGMVQEEYNITFGEDLDLSQYNTLERVANFVIDSLGSGNDDDKSQQVIVQEVAVENKQVETKATKNIVEKHENTKVSSSSKKEIIEQIITVISKQTDYPRDYLDIELDLEGDLGIDTVKQAELFGTIRESYNIEFQDDLDLSNYNTIDKIADFVLMSQPKGSKSLTTALPKDSKLIQEPTEQGSSVQTSMPDSDEILSKVLEVTCEKTGYEPEFLDDVNLDMEADLGIDTVKQAELIGELREFYNIPFQEDLDLSEVNTIAKVVKFIASHLETPKIDIKTQKQTSLVNQAEKMDELSKNSEFETYAIKELSKFTGYPVSMITLNSNLTQDFGVPDETLDELVTKMFAKRKILRPKNFIVKPILNELLASILAVQANKHADKVVRYVLTTIESSTYIEDKLGKTILFSSSRLSAFWKKLNAEQIKTAQLLKTTKSPEKFSLIFVNPTTSIGTIPQIFEALKANLDMLNRVILLVSSTQPSIQSMTSFQGAIGGMLKALDMEFDTINAKVIVTDFKNKELVSRELENLSDLEVIIKASSREVIGLQPSVLSKKPRKLTNDDVLLVSGGGQGITYQCIKALVNKGTKVGIIGRTKIRADAHEISKLTSLETDREKRKLFKQMQESDERVTPVLLEKEWAKYTKSATVYLSIQELQRLGAIVSYQPADVRNKTEVVNAVKKILKELDAPDFTHLIHGAGIEISRATKAKSIDEFMLVYEIKTKGFTNLLTTVNGKTLKRIIAFSSVAGRFGNASQVDYSAANEFLAKEVQKYRKLGINASVIDWSAWAEVGMATNSTTQKILAAAGVTQIPMSSGVEYFTKEFAHGEKGEVVIAGQLGMLARKSTILEKNQKIISTKKNLTNLKENEKNSNTGEQKTKAIKLNDETTLDLDYDFNPDKFKNYPMIDAISQNNGKIRAMRTLSLKADLYLDHHRINGKAVLPGVMGIEFMAELMTLLEKPVSEIYNVELSSPVKLPRDRELEIFALTDNQKSRHQEIYLKSKFITASGKQLGELRQHFSAGFYTNSRQPSLVGFSKKELQWFQPKRALLSKVKIYEIFFHGPRFQVLEKVLRLGKNSIVCKYVKPKESPFIHESNLEIAPFVIEACFQTAGMFDLLQNKIMSLPSSIKRIKLNEGAENPTYIYATCIRKTKTHSVYHVQAVDNDGNIVLEIFEYSMVHTSKIDVPFTHQKKEELDLAEIRFLLGNLNQHGVVLSINSLKNITSKSKRYFLSELEQSNLKTFKSEKRKLDWLAGIICAKEAIALVHNLPASEVTIQKNQDGKPFGVYQTQHFPVSISHSSGIAIALSTTHDTIAVDLEKIETKHPSFIRTSFTNTEQRTLNITPDNSTLVTLLWTIKEAAFKFDGTGIKDNLLKTEIFGSHSSGFKIKTTLGIKHPKTVCSEHWALTVINN